MNLIVNLWFNSSIKKYQSTKFYCQEKYNSLEVLELCIIVIHQQIKIKIEFVRTQCKIMLDLTSHLFICN